MAQLVEVATAVFAPLALVQLTHRLALVLEPLVEEIRPLWWQAHLSEELELRFIIFTCQRSRVVHPNITLAIRLIFSRSPSF